MNRRDVVKAIGAMAVIPTSTALANPTLETLAQLPKKPGVILVLQFFDSLPTGEVWDYIYGELRYQLVSHCQVDKVHTYHLQMRDLPD